ncbi:hypothetical protein [Billgrantia bachuensis]|uniref:Uncharacterized protein n=1 Tax=Billgrantia bachuensis TaxID=2717286 RepID=A0ABX0PLD6_9GAMM|nr:hypothetical protein [Halomonas bachuensis]NIC03975.1 hypothetical protein [Halomonas bachuensis]
MAAPTPPIPPFNFSPTAGPSQAADYGGTRDVGTMTVGDYYGTGSRVRKVEGWAWGELAVIGAVALGALAIWRKL